MNCLQGLYELKSLYKLREEKERLISLFLFYLEIIVLIKLIVN